MLASAYIHTWHCSHAMEPRTDSDIQYSQVICPTPVDVFGSPPYLYPTPLLAHDTSDDARSAPLAYLGTEVCILTTTRLPPTDYVRSR